MAFELNWSLFRHISRARIAHTSCNFRFINNIVFYEVILGDSDWMFPWEEVKRKSINEKA